jgi:hypothetical protein
VRVIRNITLTVGKMLKLMINTLTSVLYRAKKKLYFLVLWNDVMTDVDVFKFWQFKVVNI